LLPDFLAATLIFLGAVVLALPLLVYGPYAKGHDIYIQMSYTRYFNQQFWAGEFYPRWLVGMNHGLGSPSLFVFPSFQAYVYAFLDPLTNSFHRNTFAGEEFLVLFVSGICAFLWMRELFSRRIAVVVAILYMFTPYHLEIDFYLRSALGECWALAWIPLLLWGVSRIIKGKRGAMVYFAVAFALLILSHLISTFIVIAVPLAAVLVLTERGRKLRSFAEVIGGMALGAGLSSFYWLPAVRYSRYFLKKLNPPVFSTFLIDGKSLFQSSAVEPFVHTVAVWGVDAMCICGLCGVVVLMKGSQESKRQVRFWLAAAAIPAFMLCAVSTPFWAIARPIFLLIQYQFRLNTVLCCAETVILGAFLSESSWKSRLEIATRSFLLALVIVPWLFSYAAIWRAYREIPNARASFPYHPWGRFGDDGWFHEFYVGTDPDLTLRASEGPRARFTSGSGTISVASWAARHIAIETDSPSGGRVMINQFFFPSWRATLVPSGQQIGTAPSTPEGLLTAKAPEGHTTIRFDIPVELSEQFGLWISVVSLVFSAVLLWKGWSDRRISGMQREAPDG
jgi:uncharacterized membrane protein